jgi:hypothetical protein
MINFGTIIPFYNNEVLGIRSSEEPSTSNSQSQCPIVLHRVPIRFCFLHSQNFSGLGNAHKPVQLLFARFSHRKFPWAEPNPQHVFGACISDFAREV